MEDYIESNMLFDRYHQINEYKYVENNKKNIENIVHKEHKVNIDIKENTIESQSIIPEQKQKIYNK
jgi:hypothetical protein